MHALARCTVYQHNESGDLGKVFSLGLCFWNAEEKCEIQAYPFTVGFAAPFILAP